MKYKVGELYEVGNKVMVCYSILYGIPHFSHSGGEYTPGSQGLAIIRSYTGTSYEKDGKRFIPSGEGRAVKPGEWYLSTNNQPAKKKDDTYIHHPRVILLPVPEVEPDSKFAVGDLVRFEGGWGNPHRITKIEPNKVTLEDDRWFDPNNQHVTKVADPFLADTREITDEDLIRCAMVDKKKIMVVCRAECCIGESKLPMEGNIYSGVNKNGYIDFFHHGNTSSFAKMETTTERFRTNMVSVKFPRWKVEWLIPKEDIRVVEKDSSTDIHRASEEAEAWEEFQKSRKLLSGR